MERLIVNEGQGPVPRDLTAAHTSVGGAPDCDVVLRHPSAQGSAFVIERTTHGHHVRIVSGMLFHNEEACTAGDLLHNDTLRVGETLVLYKNPAATLPAAGPAVTVLHGQLAPPTFEELAILEELEPLEELQPLDEPIEVEAPITSAWPSPHVAAPAAEPVELEELETLEALEEPELPEELAELEELDVLDALEPAVLIEPAAVIEPAVVIEPAALLPAPAPTPAPIFPELPDLPALTRLAERVPEVEAAPVTRPAAATGAETAAPVEAVRAPLRPADGIRFRRPLPPGRRGPTSLPPAHPGRPRQ